MGLVVDLVVRWCSGNAVTALSSDGAPGEKEGPTQVSSGASNATE